jgi:hypothetical protein
MESEQPINRLLAALNQVRGGLANPRCAGGLQGTRWSSDFAIHYERCLGASFGAPAPSAMRGRSF